MKTSIRLTSLAFLVLAVSLPTSAALAQTKIAFVTSETTDGSIDEPGFATGIASADAICNRLAAAASPATISASAVADGFKAWLSDSSSSPLSTFTQATVPYVLVGGTQIAPNWTGLVDGLLDEPIRLSEHGVQPAPPLNSVQVWTYTSASGADAGHGFNCLNWTDQSNVQFGGYGLSSHAIGSWTDSSARVCWELRHLYCFQQGSLPVELQSFSID